MTAEEIQNGGAFRAVVRREYRKFLHTLVQAIEYCDDRNTELTEVGEAGFARIHKLFAECSDPIRNRPTTAEDRLLSTWAYMILHCIDSNRQFSVYAEANALLEDMMAGGWFV